MKRAIQGAILGCLAVCAMSLGQFAHMQLPQAEAPPPPHAQKFDFSTPSPWAMTGLGGLVGAITWIRAIQEYAEIIFMGAEPTALPGYFFLASQSDTLWHQPSLIAAWAIPQLKGYNNADAEPFLRVAANRFPSKWQFRITWATYALENPTDSIRARDSAAAILLPLTRLNDSIPDYARNLAFTLLHKNGRPEEAMSLLLETYQQVPDPLVRHQFRVKIMDLLHRNQVSLGTDSVDFQEGLAQMLEAKEDASRKSAHRLLVDLVDTTRRVQALPFARNLAQQYADYRRQMAAK
ncbi:MAG: hypothetical protein IPN71_10870 [Fibrobacteres bacterium]|nr:hypothetical protein [Fibrobacterota bacterium]